MKKQLIPFLALLFTAIHVHAENKLTSNAELGVVLTGGNTETQTTNGKIHAVYELEKWKHSGSLEALGSSTTDVSTDVKTTTAEKYSANAKSDYKFNEFDFMFGALSYDDDRFSGFAYQATVSTGYGRNILRNDKHQLSAEIGPGMRFFKLDPDPVLGPIPSDDEAIVHMAASYVYKITETSSFSQDIVVDAGEDNTISESVSALSAQINGKLAMKASIKVRNTSEVPVGTEKTDTESALTLVYAIR